jgi:hypothetical protein
VKLARYKLYLLDVLEVRWDKEGTVRAGDYIFSMEKETKIINREKDSFFVHRRMVLARKRVYFVSDRMSYSHIFLRGRWCIIIVLKVHAPNEGKSDDSKDNLYEELE